MTVRQPPSGLTTLAVGPDTEPLNGCHPASYELTAVTVNTTRTTPVRAPPLVLSGFDHTASSDVPPGGT